MTDSQRIIEIIREKVFQRFNQEIPYTLSQRLHDWRLNADGSLFVEMMLMVDNLRHKMMIVGSKGEVLKGIQRRAERDASASLKKKIELKLSVVVRKNTEELIEHEGYSDIFGP